MRVAEAEHATVGGDLPVARGVVGRGHGDDGLVEADAARAAVELRVAEAEDARRRWR